MGKVVNLSSEMRQAPSSLKALVDKNVLSNTEARILLTRAASDLGPHEYFTPVKGAVGIILNDLLPMFPEDGGD
jgi:hypothetical protein